MSRNSLHVIGSVGLWLLMLLVGGFVIYGGALDFALFGGIIEIANHNIAVGIVKVTLCGIFMLAGIAAIKVLFDAQKDLNSWKLGR